MKVTDYDITGNAFTLYRENISEQSVEYIECKRKDFIQFMAEWKGYLYDVNGFLVVPLDEEGMVYDIGNDHFMIDSQVVTVYTFEDYCNAIQSKDKNILLEYFSEFADSSFKDDDWLHHELYTLPGNPQLEAYQEFKRDNCV